MSATLALCLFALPGAVSASGERGAQIIVHQNADAYREGQIWATYGINPTLQSYEIGIDVDAGQATLTGTVQSPIERRLAERSAARVDGINQVDNQIVLDPVMVITVIDANPGFAQFVSDATIDAMLQSKLLWNDHTDALDIDVNVLGGVVTLSGEADSGESKLLADMLASTTPGAIKVQNYLSVTTKEGQVLVAEAQEGDRALSDTWIAAKVKSSINWTRGIDHRRIQVSADDGVVTLAGTVGSAEQKRLAIEVARSVRGVKSIDASGVATTQTDTALSQH